NASDGLVADRVPRSHLAELSLVLPGACAVFGAFSVSHCLGPDQRQRAVLRCSTQRRSAGIRGPHRRVHGGGSCGARPRSVGSVAQECSSSPGRDNMRALTAVDPTRYHESIDEARPLATRGPVCLYLEITNRCNLLCTTCPRTYATLEPEADMSWELFTRIVDQVPDIARVV